MITAATVTTPANPYPTTVGYGETTRTTAVLVLPSPRLRLRVWQ